MVKGGTEDSAESIKVVVAPAGRTTHDAPEQDMQSLIVTSLAVFVAAVGITHFIFPRYFMTLVPPRIPWARSAVYATGVLEVAFGIGLLLNPLQSVAAWATVGLMAVYVLTHVEALMRAGSHQPRWLDRPAGAATRIVVNLCYLVWAIAAALLI